MENASKAIIIAGAILIAVGLMSLFLIFFQMFKDYNGTVENSRTSQEVNDFNRYFVNSSYDVDGNTGNGIQIYGYDVYNIVLKAFELSQRSDLYIINIKINGVNMPENLTLDETKGWLANIGLDYSKLSYDLTLVDDQYQQAVSPEERNAMISNFKQKYNYKITKYDVEGRVYSIEINKI